MIAILEGTFAECRKLESITLPSSFLLIGSDAFRDDHLLCNVYIPNNIIHIGSRAFSYTGQLGSIIIPDSVRYIGDEVFSKSGISGLYFTENNLIEHIETNILGGCFSLPNNRHGDLHQDERSITVFIPDSIYDEQASVTTDADA